MRALSCRAQERSIRSTPIERLLLSCRLHPASPRACRRGSLLLHRRSCSKPQHSCRHRVRSLAAIAALAGSRLARGSLSAGRLLLCSLSAAGQQTDSASPASAAAAPGPSTGSMEAATSCAAPSDLASPVENFPMVSVSWPASSMLISQKLGIHFVYIKHIAETASKRASRQYKLVHRRPRGRRTARPEGGERAGQKHEATMWSWQLLGLTRFTNLRGCQSTRRVECFSRPRIQPPEDAAAV